MAVLDDEGISTALRQAWQDSQPGTAQAHEEGGFILREAGGTLSVERWPRGLQNEIVVPPHPGGKQDQRIIVATFHTHPNPTADFQQDPSLTDIRAVRDDPDLRHPEYEGEYVIAQELVYRVLPDGRVESIAHTMEVLNLPEKAGDT